MPDGAVGLVLVSHSRTLADSVAVLARQMAGAAARIAIAAGAGEDRSDLGTDATEIAVAIEALDSAAGTLVLMDLGSAILSAETALDLIDPAMRERVLLSAGPFVEGTLAAAVAAAGGAPLGAVRDEALGALGPKRAQVGGDVSGEERIAGAAVGEAGVGGAEWARTVRIADPAGLHMRPAAEIARVVRVHGARATISPADHPARAADAVSLTAMLGLDLRAGAVVRVSARGEGAAAVLAASERILSREMWGQETGSQEAEPAAGAGSGAGPVAVSPGIAIGPAFNLRREFPRVPRSRGDPEAAKTALVAALARAGDGIESGGSAILAAQRELIDDPALLERALALIEQEKLAAAPAWAEAVEEAAGRIAALDDPILSARASDLKDAGLRVLAALGVAVADGLPAGMAPCIVIAEDLAPTLAASFDPARVLGVIDRAGGATTHAAILLRARGIPAVAGAFSIGEIADGTLLAIDGAEGRIWREPDDETRAMLEAERRAAREENATVGGIVSLADGSVVELWANAATSEEAQAARRADARGIGLLRSEFLFLERANPPSEEEQAAALAAVIEPMRGRPVILRTLDAGADKPIPFLPLGHEENPFLGVRGIRATLAHPALFASQLRAFLRAGCGHELGIMLPMVTEPAEVAAARDLLGAAHRDLLAVGVPHAWPVGLGIMVEVPAAALRIATFRDLCDFYSIGTNDLTQYVLAADRGNARLARFHDAGHEAVIGLCRQVAAEGGRPTSVCGEAAGEPRIAVRLVGAGIRRLSMAPALFGPVGLTLRRGGRGGGG